MSEHYETVEVPTVTLADGRKAIRLTDYVEHKWVADFVKAWPDFWKFDAVTDCFVSPPLPSQHPNTY